MRVPLERFDEVVTEPGFAVVTLGPFVVRVQVMDGNAVLFPERSVKHRRLAKRLALVD